MHSSTVILGTALICAVLAPATSQAQAAAPSAEVPRLKVGDSWRWLRSDKRTGLKEAETLRTITGLSADRIEGTENEGNIVLTPDLQMMESPEWTRQGTPRFIDWPLAVGKKWSFKYVQEGKSPRYSTRWSYDAEVVAYEKVKVPAGEFDAFKLVYRGNWNNDTSRANGGAKVTSWYAPAARASVRTDVEAGNTLNVTELVELKLQP